MNIYKVCIGYGDDPISIQFGGGFNTYATVEAESTEKAAEYVYNGLDPMDCVNICFQVFTINKNLETNAKPEYFTF